VWRVLVVREIEFRITDPVSSRRARGANTAGAPQSGYGAPITTTHSFAH